MVNVAPQLKVMIKKTIRPKDRAPTYIQSAGKMKVDAETFYQITL